MMTIVHYIVFRHMKKMKTTIGSCLMTKQLSKTSERWSLLAPFPGQDWQNSIKYILKKLTKKYYTLV